MQASCQSWQYSGLRVHQGAAEVENKRLKTIFSLTVISHSEQSPQENFCKKKKSVRSIWSLTDYLAKDECPDRLEDIVPSGGLYISVLPSTWQNNSKQNTRYPVSCPTNAAAVNGLLLNLALCSLRKVKGKCCSHFCVIWLIAAPETTKR